MADNIKKIYLTANPERQVKQCSQEFQAIQFLKCISDIGRVPSGSSWRGGAGPQLLLAAAGTVHCGPGCCADGDSPGGPSLCAHLSGIIFSDLFVCACARM